MRRRNAFTPSWLDRLEDRVTLSHLGVHHAAHVRRHHHASHGHHHQAGAVAPGTPTPPTAPTAAPNAPTAAPTAPATPPTAPAIPPTAPGTSPTAAALALTGKVEGGAPLDGSGTVGPLGTVTSTGTLGASGAAPVTYTGTETLIGASGSITLSLFGRLSGPPSIGAPIELTYTITGGTGAFQGATGSGKAVLSFELPPSFGPSPTPSASTFLLSFGDAA